VSEGGRTLRRLLVVIGGACLLGLVPLLSGLVGGLILFVITRSLHARLSRVVPPRVSSFTIAMGVFVLLLLPASWAVGRIVGEASDVLRSFHTDDAVAWLAHTPFAGLDLAATMKNVSANLVAWLSTRALSVFGGVTATVLNVFVALFGLYYLLVDGRRLWARVQRVLPIPRSVSDLLAARFAEVTEALLLGTMFTAILQGVIVGGSFALVGLPAPLLWGFVTACVSVLPIFGSALVWLPGAVVLFVQDRPLAALTVLAFGAGAASNLDNVVRLFVFRRVSGIHPMLTLVGAFAGMRMLGVVGAFLGPLLLSYFFELLTVYEEATHLSESGSPMPRDGARSTLRQPDADVVRLESIRGRDA
jgi:predicted PurR-regulated permease PerM